MLLFLLLHTAAALGLLLLLLLLLLVRRVLLLSPWSLPRATLLLLSCDTWGQATWLPVWMRDNSR
jgi:hypothetical protein